ncbi:uncharacterized protein LOC110457340 [Mizuhopecten yessoensis]|uniref:Uncharacterized protein n=1 Tax=Mizuhopecten yessoensis TaxID=6573 RepID=A0A210R3I8_MIZYE|nr:uncharacterized protein LOC110457340 [Mizuhopecten yessoensis]OWF55640.1 hypothetical protein KP79_PYT20984 [Mizuhopecten yessoensis]
MTRILTYIVACLTVTSIAATFECFCNFLHPEYFVLPCADTLHRPIGTINMPDHVLNKFYAYDLNDRYCKARLAGVQAPQGYEAILHYGQLGYLRLDSGFRVDSCIGTVMISRGHLNMSGSCTHNITGPIGLVNLGPTTPPTISSNTVPTKAIQPVGNWHTFPQPVVTTPRPTHHWILLGGASRPGCRRADIDAAIQGGKSIYHSDARVCGHGGVSFDESVPLAFCSIKERVQWKQYLQVRPHCKQLAVYTPVSVFINGKLFDGSGSGIFIGCTSSGGFKIARQTCASGKIEVVDINPGHSGILENVDNYFIIQ